MSTDDDYDYWTETPKTSPSASKPALNIETIEGAEPLDDQFGVVEPLTVPAILHDVLFGQPDATEAEVAAHDGDLARVPPMRTYAILDAAKLTNLPEMLKTSGLPHRCLFKGSAYDELRDVAPWIVQIEDGDRFTRNLFTQGNAGWHLWDKEPGIYIRSRASLDEMWGHFRKFTKIQDGSGKWYYWRFWEPRTMAYYLDGVSASRARLQQIFVPRGGHPVSRIIATSSKNSTAAVLEISPNAAPHNAQLNGGGILELDVRYTEDFLEASIALLRKYVPELDNWSDRALMRLARQNVPSFHQFDLVSKPVIANALGILALCGHPLDHLPAAELGLLRDKSQSQFRRTTILLQQVKQRVFAPYG